MSAGSWSDLAPRLISAAAMAAIGFAAIWLGGAVFGALVAAMVGIVLWEITRMLLTRAAADDPAVAVGMALPVAIGLSGAIVVFMVGYLGTLMLIFVQASLVLAGMLSLPRERARFALYGAWVILAGTGLIVLRVDAGLVATLWLVSVVIATDVAGYFAGRIIGGPKFWPRISPKKTWAGTIAGWIAAAIIGGAFATGTANPLLVGALSALLAFASQMGDAAESALKRHTGVKDSSALIPGHGGVFDRFDALLGASLVMTVIGILA